MIARFESKVESLQVKVDRLQAFRLYSFLVFIAFMVFAYFAKIEALYAPVIVIFSSGFTYLLIKYNRTKKHLDHVLQLKTFIERQQARRAGTYKLLKPPSYLDLYKDLPLSRDLDLIGDKSLYSQISESLTEEGDLYLIENILNGSKHARTYREQILSNVKSYHKDKRHFNKRLKDENLHLEPLVAWSKDSSTSIPPMAFYSVYIGYAVFLFSLFTPFKNIGLTLYLFSYVVSFAQFYRAFDKAIELEFLLFSLRKHLEYLLAKKWISESGFKSLRRVSKWVSFLSIQANPLVLVLLNFVFPWTAFFTHLLGAAKKEVAKEVPSLVTALKEWDYLFSLRTVYHYQTQTFASLQTKADWKAENIFHPLLSNPIKNSFSLQSLALITGSNMSGKSTFLRTIGINQVLACMGAPVFARSLTTWPTKILSCIRVSDSLEHGISYFYAEVLRLKQIVTESKTSPCLFLIDEIFRGTNNKERFIGAKSLILELSRGPSIGVVTTHDLDLVDLEKLDSNIKNYHFHDEVREKELHFSYTLNEGPSKSTNALQILKNVGLPVLQS
jgi:hypothetical protein